MFYFEYINSSTRDIYSSSECGHCFIFIEKKWKNKKQEQLRRTGKEPEENDEPRQESGGVFPS